MTQVQDSNTRHAEGTATPALAKGKRAADAIANAATRALGGGMPACARHAFRGAALQWLALGAPRVTLAGVAERLSRRPLRGHALKEMVRQHFPPDSPEIDEEHDGDRIQFAALLVAAALRVRKADFELFGIQRFFTELDDIVGGTPAGDSLSSFLQIARKFARTGAWRMLAPLPAVGAFATVAKAMPNFREVADFYEGQAALLRLARVRSAVFPPVLLLGPPGVGKTLFAMRMARLIRSPFRIIPMSSQTAGWILTGLDRSWSTSRPGMVLSTLLASAFGNPVLVVDEIDKASADARYNPLGGLFQLLERDTAQVFVDEFAGIPVNTTGVNWIMTANDADSIPEPILSRLTAFTIECPRPAQARRIVVQQFRRIKGRAAFQGLPSSVIDALAQLAPREMGLQLRIAVGRAARRALACGLKRAAVRVEDLPARPAMESRPFGFVTETATAASVVTVGATTPAARARGPRSAGLLESLVPGARIDLSDVRKLQVLPE